MVRHFKVYLLNNNLMDKRKKDDYKKYYEIIGTIGKGSYGNVYKGKNKLTNELRAIKEIDLDIIKQNLLEEYDIKEIKTHLQLWIDKFKNEYENMKKCSKSNNSVECYEYFENNKIFVIIMELCDINLSQLLMINFEKYERGFSVEEIYEIMTQLNNALKIMKNNNIIHRDLKLENILIKYIDEEHKKFIVKLTDYGCSISLNSLSSINILHSFVGTIIYMAPELLKKEEYNYKCDLWSLGIIIYKLYFARSPFSGLTEESLKKNIEHFKSNNLKKIGNEDLDDLVKKLLEKEKEKRLSWDTYFNHPFFKIKYKNTNIGNSQNYQNNKFILNILSSLISLYLFENYLINKIKESSQNTFSKNSSNIYVMDICYLVNKSFISTLKKMFSYQEIETIIKSNNITLNSVIDKNLLNKINEHYLKTILNKEKDFEKFILNNQILQIEESASKNNSQILYPTNFNILNYDSYQKLLEICKMKENQTQNSPFYFGFNYGKIVLRAFNKNNSLNNYNENFVYVVSLKQKDIDINYIQEMLFYFFGNYQDIVNNFNKIIADADIIKSFSFNSKSFEKFYNCKGYIINQEIFYEINKRENNLNKYLSYINFLHNEYFVLNKKINEQNSLNLAYEENEYYLISRRYINDIENLLHFKDISVIIRNIQSLNVSLDLVSILREQIQGELYNSLSELNNENIKNKLKDKNSYLLSSLNNIDNEPIYYNNCQIISTKIMNFIKAIDPNNYKDNNDCNFIKLIKCIFDKGNIIIFLNNKTINLGKLNEDNEFNIDYIIKLKNDNSFDTYFTNIKKNGYNYIEKYIINANEKFIKVINDDKNQIKLIEEYKISENLHIIIQKNQLIGMK